MKAGDSVIIRLNPHHPNADNIVGTVMVYRPGAGFGGCVLADVHYKNPRDGKGYTMPFGLACLAKADPAALIRLADYYETMAARLRALAESLIQDE